MALEPEHSLLARMEGDWRGTARLWFEPGEPHEEQEVSGSVVLLGDGRWARHDYSTPIDGATHSGSQLIGFHRDERVWQVAWVDTFHTGSEIMRLEGAAEDAGAISVLGSYGAGDGPRWGWRTSFEPATGSLAVRHWNITPDGEETLAVQFDYARA